MPGINIYVLGVYNPGFFLSEIGWGGGGGCLSRVTGEAGEKILLAGKRGIYIYIAGIFLYDIVLLNITAAQVKYSIDKTEY